jgi:hypothetical protein
LFCKVNCHFKDVIFKNKYAVRQIKKVTNQKGYKLKRLQIKKVTNQKGYKSKRLQIKKVTNQKDYK